MALTKAEWDERKPMLRLLWDSGLPTKDIASRMGLSKNAVIGAARRLNLLGRPDPIIRDPSHPGHLSAEERREKHNAREAARREAHRGTLPPLKSVAEVISTPPEQTRSIPDLIVVPPPPIPHAGRDHRIMMAVGKANALSHRGPTLPPIAATPPPAPDTPRPFARIRECAWPIGDPGTLAYRTCDAPADGKRSYCAEHCSVAYTRTPPRQMPEEEARMRAVHLASVRHQRVAPERILSDEY